jgi:CubicO group peptidase (beta-lactamase class C family)
MRAVAVLATLSLAASPLAAQAIGPRVDSVFAQFAAPDGAGCIVGVRQAGTTTHARAYGMANLEYGIPLTVETISESGSVAKQFTAAALALLAHEGKLSLDDDVRRHIPELPDFGAPITIRMLLNHTSGLRDQWALLGLMGNPPGRQVHTVGGILYLATRQQRLNFAPNTEYLYSNMGYVLAGIIVQRVSGQSLQAFTRERFFQPLGMTRTEWRENYRKVVPGRATAYARERNGWVQDMPFTMVIGNGGLLSTVGDWLTWNDALANGTIPGGRVLVQALETRGRLADGTEIEYALGLTVTTWNGLREVSHGGATAGYRTFLARWPERNTSVALLCNAGNANAAMLAHRVADVVLGPLPDPAPPRPAVTLPLAALEPLVGTWRDSTNDQTLTLATRDGRLVIANGGATAAMTPLGDGRFWHASAGEFQVEREGGEPVIRQREEGPRTFRRQPRIDPATVRPGEFAGRYTSAELGISYELRSHADRLYLHFPPSDSLPMTALYPDGFGAQGRTVRFMRDPAGRVTGLRIFAGRARDVRFHKEP